MEHRFHGTKGKVLSGLIWKFGERIMAQAVSVLISVILARLLLPEYYGTVALVMVFISLADVFVSSGFGSALIQKYDADDLDFSSVFYISICISVILYILIFFSASAISAFYKSPILEPALRVLGIRIIIAAVNSVQHAYVSRNMLFKKFFWSTLIGTVASGIIGVWMAYQGYGIWALIAQYMANTCIDTVVLWITVKWRPCLKFSWHRVSGLLSFGWKLLVSSLLNTGYNQLRTLLIGKFYTKSDLAFYNQGEKYPSLIVTNIDASISSVIFPVLSQNQNDSRQIKEMTRKAIQTSSYLMWPVMIGLCICAEPFVRLLLTEKWLPCVPFLRILAISYGLWPIHTANLQAITAMGRSDLFLWLEIIKKTFGILMLVIALRFGPIAIAISMFLSSIISTYVNSKPNNRLLNYSFKELLLDILPSLGLSCAMGLLVFPFSCLEVSDFLILMIQIVSGVVIYVGLSAVTRNKSFLYLLGMIAKKAK